MATRKLSIKKIVVLCIVCLFAIIVSLAGAYALNLYSQFQHVKLEATDDDLGIAPEKQVDTSTDITNIALFGVDSRSNEFEGNSDSIMILSVDKQHNKVKLISILRDSLVKVDGHGYTKITEAYGYGGAPLAIKTINQNYNMDIRDYVTINFNGMAEIIDAVGGVTVNVTKEEIPTINGTSQQMAEALGEPIPPKITQPGSQTLCGLQAVAYSRIRKVDNPDGSWGDFGRTSRQRAVMDQLFQKALTMSVSQYPAFIESLLPYVETSLDIGEIMDLAMILTRDGITLEQTGVPATEYTINAGFSYNGKSTVYYNLEYAASLIHAFIYDDIPPETYMAQNVAPMTGPLEASSSSSSSSSKTNSYSSSQSTSSSPSSTNKTSSVQTQSSKASYSSAASSIS